MRTGSGGPWRRGRTRGGRDQPYRGRAHRRRAAQQRSAGRGVRRDAGGREPQRQPGSSWTQPTGKARQSEILIQQLLAEAGASGISPELVSIDARGDWTIGDQAAVLHDVNGWIVFRFHAATFTSSWAWQHEETACDSGYSSTDNFRVRPTEQMLTKTGHGTPGDQRLYQLIRQRDPVHEHVRGHVPRRRRSGACLHLRVIAAGRNSEKRHSQPVVPRSHNGGHRYAICRRRRGEHRRHQPLLRRPRQWIACRAAEQLRSRPAWPLIPDLR